MQRERERSNRLLRSPEEECVSECMHAGSESRNTPVDGRDGEDERGFCATARRTTYRCPKLRRRRAIAPPIKSAVPNSSAVPGSGTGAGGPGSIGVGGGLKAWSGSFFGQPQLKIAAARVRPRIKRFGRILTSCRIFIQERSEAEDRILFLMGVPSLHLK